MENHHCSIAFKLLREEEYNIFDNLEYANFKKLRKKTISNILATDMKFHFELMKKFKVFQESDHPVEEVD